MTPAEYGNFKAQLKAREDGDWKRVDWSLARRPLLNELEVVHGRMIAPNPKVWSRQSRTFRVTECLYFTGRISIWVASRDRPHCESSPRTRALLKACASIHL